VIAVRRRSAQHRVRTLGPGRWLIGFTGAALALVTLTLSAFGAGTQAPPQVRRFVHLVTSPDGPTDSALP
jgi:hypothetical protein